MIESQLHHIKSALPVGVKLIAVSKKKPVTDIQQAYGAGQIDFGENYVQELVDKHETLPKDIHWHFIGHLQRNKVKYIAPFVHLIHGVDSEKLLKEINKQGKKIDRVISVLLQVHIATEDSKFGFDANEIKTLLEEADFSELKHVQIRGLMGMASNTKDEVQVGNEFGELRNLFHEVKMHPALTNHKFTELSMGMTQDYHIALENGSSMVRIGSAIFGARN